jgi:ABC-type uncharacterized transport system permease subunit
MIMLNILSLFFYIVAFILFLLFYFKNKNFVITLAISFTIMGIISNLVFIIIRWNELGFFPTVTFSDTLIFLAFIIAVLFIFFYFIYKNIHIFIFIIPFLSILIIIALLLNFNTKVDIEKGSLLLYIHLPFSITGTALFFLSASAGIMYFYQEKQLKNKNLNFINKQLLSLDSINKITNNLLIFGFIIFTIGLITGFIWRFYAENIEKYSYQTKLIFSVITWCIFGALIFIKKVKGLPPKKLAMGSIIGFVCLIVTYIGLAIFLSGK